jgi:hypothetical protein
MLFIAKRKMLHVSSKNPRFPLRRIMLVPPLRTITAFLESDKAGSKTWSGF